MRLRSLFTCCHRCYALSITLSGTFSLLNMGSLRETAEMSKPDFVLNPDKYFGEKVEEKPSNSVQFPTFTETLKAVFDEGSLFPREILERELEAKQLNERMFQESKIKRNKKTTKIIEK